MIRQLGVSSNTLCAHPAMRRLLLEAYPAARLWDGERITDEDTLIEHLKGCDAAIVGFEPVTEKVLAALPELRIIAKFGAGCETIDFEALERHEVRFGYTFGVNRLAVAELALSFMISALRMITQQNQSMRAGERPRNRNGRLLIAGSETAEQFPGYMDGAVRIGELAPAARSPLKRAMLSPVLPAVMREATGSTGREG